MVEEDYKTRFNNLANDIKEFIGRSWAGTDAKGRSTYVDYDNIISRIQKQLGESPEQSLLKPAVVVEADLTKPKDWRLKPKGGS